MRAVVLPRFGPPDVLQAQTVPDPEPGPGQVKVRVGAVALGRTLDVAARAGRLPFAAIRLPHILGAEHAGTVAAVGPGVERVHVGDRVAVTAPIACGTCAACRDDHQERCPRLEFVGIHRPGAYAEYTVVPETVVSRLSPELAALDDVSVAAMALVGPLARYQLDVAAVDRGSVVLIQGGASALGSMAVVLALQRGARVLATTRSEAKRARLAALGAEALDPEAPHFVHTVRERTDGRGVDAVLDNLGAAFQFERDLAVLAPGGSLVTSGAFLGGRPVLDWRTWYTQSYRLIGIRTLNRPSVEAFWQNDVPRGARAPIDRVYPLEEAALAHRRLESGENFGKVLLVPEGIRV